MYFARINRRETKIKFLFQTFWEFKLVNNPEFATRIGIRKYDDRLRELSLSAFRRRASSLQLFLEKATKIRKSIDLKSNPTMELNLDLLERYFSCVPNEKREEFY